MSENPVKTYPREETVYYNVTEIHESTESKRAKQVSNSSRYLV